VVGENFDGDAGVVSFAAAAGEADFFVDGIVLADEAADEPTTITAGLVRLGAEYKDK